jgi:hypothetical protein
MSRFTLNLATPADDAALAELLAATPMTGAISIAFARNPSYLAASAVDGRRVQVAVARDDASGQVVGMGSRAISPRFVNGERVPVGYLSGLRLKAEYRGHGGLLARGYRYLRQLHEDGEAAYYLTTIADDNPAGSVLTSARAGLPIYHPWGHYHTLVISTSRHRRQDSRRIRSFDIRAAQVTDRDAIIAFLNAHAARRQFLPAYDRQDLFSNGGLLLGLHPADILLAICDGEIVGTLGCWDQRSFKQIIVQGYSRWLSRLRPIYNAWAALWRHPMLPPAGSTLPASLSAIPAVQSDWSDVFEQLLETTIERLAERGEPLLLVGLHQSDPLLQSARKYAGRAYVTTMYLVYWPEHVPDIDRLQRLVPYLELGSL